MRKALAIGAQSFIYVGVVWEFWLLIKMSAKRKWVWWGEVWGTFLYQCVCTC
jgi:hypothetical protein